MIGAKRFGGFTLIEIVVALVVFSVLSVLLYQGFSILTDYERRKRSDYDSHNELQHAWVVILQDLLHVRARPERVRLGGSTYAYHTQHPEYLITFTRGGLPLVPGAPAGLQRVAYSLSDDGELLRWVWPTLDSFLENEPDSVTLMGGLRKLEFLHLNLANEFEPDWPPLRSSIPLHQVPRMIQVRIELSSGETYERLIPGIEVHSP